MKIKIEFPTKYPTCKTLDWMVREVFGAGMDLLCEPKWLVEGTNPNARSPNVYSINSDEWFSSRKLFDLLAKMLEGKGTEYTFSFGTLYRGTMPDNHAPGADYLD